MDILNIELWDKQNEQDSRQCSGCPCFWIGVPTGCGCGLHYWRSEHIYDGWKYLPSGEIYLGDEEYLADLNHGDWEPVRVRPQSCIDERGE